MYFILGLPRSRTTWLSVFLSQGNICYHEKSMEFRNLEELKLFCEQNPKCGISDTALLIHWKWIRQNIPEAKIVVIERDIKEVKQSLQDIGLPTECIKPIKDKLEEARQDPNIVFIKFEDLNKKLYCKLIYEYCKEEPLDDLWYEVIKGIEMQPNKELLLKEMNKNIINIASLYWK
jgi:hypothetical protein